MPSFLHGPSGMSWGWRGSLAIWDCLIHSWHVHIRFFPSFFIWILWHFVWWHFYCFEVNLSDSCCWFTLDRLFCVCLLASSVSIASEEEVTFLVLEAISFSFFRSQSSLLFSLSVTSLCNTIPHWSLNLSVSDGYLKANCKSGFSESLNFVGFILIYLPSDHFGLSYKKTVGIIGSNLTWGSIEGNSQPWPLVWIQLSQLSRYHFELQKITLFEANL